MKQHNLFNFLLLVCSINLVLLVDSKAQTYSGSAILTTQEQVNVFGANNYTGINGNLEINSNIFTAITDLKPLSALTSVGGTLLVRNTQLTTLTGLDAITFVGGNLSVENNTVLTEFCSLFPLLKDGVLTGSYHVVNNGSDPSLSQIVANGACSFNGDVTLSTQEEVYSFGANKYVEITGYLHIDESVLGDITDLSPLSGLTSVGGDLHILTNGALTNLSGLGSLTSISGNLKVELNNSLNSLAGLDALIFVGQYLEVQDNSKLYNFCALFPLLNAGGLTGTYNVTGNPFNPPIADIITGACDGLFDGDVTLASQAEIDAFYYTKITGNLTIRESISGNITDLSPLSGLASVGGYLELVSNDALTNLDGLSGITSVGEDLELADNDALINIDGLRNIDSVNDIVLIQGNIALTNLDGLSGLLYAGGIEVKQNPLLFSFCGLYPLLSDGVLFGSYTVINNHVSNPNPTQQQIKDEGRCPFEGDITLRTQAEVDNFGALNHKGITGNFTILAANSGNIIDITPLSVLTSVGGYLRVFFNPALTNLDGLNGLTSVGSYLWVNSNSALTNLDGLNGLTSVGSSLQVISNSALTNLDGLNGLTSVGSYLWVNSNSALTNLDGLSGITSVGDELYVRSNAALTNLDGLSGIDSVGGYLEVAFNAALTSFCGLYPLIIAEGLVGSYSVSDNAINPSEQDIIDGGACAVELSIIIYLEGAYSTPNNMSTSLTSIPLISPYAQDPQTVTEIPANVVDWVQVELRDSTDKTIILASRSAFVLNTGDVVDIDGTSPVAFDVSADNYYVSVTHRNHLAVMSNAAVSVN